MRLTWWVSPFRRPSSSASERTSAYIWGSAGSLWQGMSARACAHRRSLLSATAVIAVTCW